jgi:non-specific serine/threonine protein kinase
MLGDTARAEAHAQRAITEASETGHAWYAGAATGVLAHLHLQRGNLEEATRLYGENLQRYRELGDQRGMGGAIAGFGAVALRLERKPLAARLLGAARAIGDEIGVAHLGNKGLSERIEQSVRAAMNPSAYQGAWDAGYALGREWAFSEAESLTFEVLKRRASRDSDPLHQAGLSRRESEVFYLLSQRLTDKEIATALSISPRTAMNHVAHIIAKLGLTNRREVSRWARQHGMA